MRLRRDQGGKLSASQSRELTKVGLSTAAPLNFASILFAAKRRVSSSPLKGLSWVLLTTKLTLGLPALPAHQPLGPVRHRRLGAEAFGHFGRVGLDLGQQPLHLTMSVKRAAAALSTVTGEVGRGRRTRICGLPDPLLNRFGSTYLRCRNGL
jgi:hypothetical protein